MTHKPGQQLYTILFIIRHLSGLFQYESGAATAYISRNQAIKRLQLSLADFR